MNLKQLIELPVSERFVLVTWEDATHEGGWKYLKDKDPSNLYKLSKVKSIGYLIKCDEKALILAQSCTTWSDESSDDVCIADVLTIPGSCVMSVQVLTPVDGDLSDALAMIDPTMSAEEENAMREEIRQDLTGTDVISQTEDLIKHTLEEEVLKEHRNLTPFTDEQVAAALSNN